jgi:hypothetical protein
VIAPSPPRPAAQGSPLQRGQFAVRGDADPTDFAAVDEIALLTKLSVEPVVASEPGIVEAIKRYYGKE